MPKRIAFILWIALLSARPGAAEVQDKEGKNPLHHAIEKKADGAKD